MTRPSWDDYFLDQIAPAVATRSTCPRLQVGAVLVKHHRIIGTGYNGAPPGEPHCEDVGCQVVPCRHWRCLDFDDPGHHSDTSHTRCTQTVLHPGGHCARAIHAEANALINALVPAWGAVLYCTHRPCPDCTKLLLGAGVSDLRWRDQADSGGPRVISTCPAPS